MPSGRCKAVQAVLAVQLCRLPSDVYLSVSTDRAAFSYDVTAQKEFFFLTMLSVKLSHQLKDEDVCLIPTEKLFHKAAEQGVPFHKVRSWLSSCSTDRDRMAHTQFHDWIDHELTKAYLEARAAGGPGSLAALALAALSYPGCPALALAVLALLPCPGPRCPALPCPACPALAPWPPSKKAIRLMCSRPRTG